MVGVRCLIILLAGLATTAAAAPCDSPAHRQFDFWMGEWEVHTPDGQAAGENHISREEGLCLLVERWRSVLGGTGQSYNFLEPETGKWRQLWVSQGVIIDITGGLTEHGAMRLEGSIHYHGNGRKTAFTGEWTPNEDGTVTQAFTEFDETTNTWKPWFTGIYTRKAD